MSTSSSNDQPGRRADDKLATTTVLPPEFDHARLAAMDRESIDALLLLSTERLQEVLLALRMAGEHEAVHAALSNISFTERDRSERYSVISAALGTSEHKAHDWILDYGIAGARAKMIASTVLPYVAEHHPTKKLFRALKGYELDCLTTGTPLIDVEHLRCLILQAPENHVTSPERVAPLDEHRIAMPSAIFNALLRLAWLSPDHAIELARRYEGAAFIQAAASLKALVPTYLVSTHLGYPMGGGESFVHQTCQILVEFGVRCVWQSFFDPRTGAYTETSLTHTPYYIDIRNAGANCEADIRQAIDDYAPDLLHGHGGTSDAIMELSRTMRCRALVGCHFWGGLIELGDTGNQHILEHLGRHKLARKRGPDSDTVVKYVASEFMSDVYTALGGTDNLEIIHPTSDPAQFMADRSDMGTYVLQVNICALKGGRIFQRMVQELGDHIPMMGVQTEPEASTLYDELQDDLTSRPLCVIHGYGSVREFYRSARIVVVPTLVDETFCRVAYEAAMNGIPVLTTRNGFLPQMFGEHGFYLEEDPQTWVDTIARIYHDAVLLNRVGKMQKERVTSTFDAGATGFMSMTMRLIDQSIRKNVGIFTVWGDQGLGNLSHTHAKLLRGMGYTVHIFSFQPYSALGRSLTRQRDPEDWTVPAHADSVYYSFNCREEVTVNELSQFILANKIHTLWVPEICWQPNWDRLFSLNIANLKVCAIPMAEIVLKGEAHLHNRLTSTLFCTRIAEKALRDEGVVNGAFLGHGFQRALPPARSERKRRRLRQNDKLRLLHVAGHNPNVRKNTRQVIDAFAIARASRDDIELTVTSMDPVATYYPDKIPPGVHIIDRVLSRDDIMDMYEEHDVSIQVSSHEGLGLGFYESVSRNTPVVSLKAPPHDEIVLQNHTGWLIPAWPCPPADNDQSIVPAWRFHTSDLAFQIIMLDKRQVEEVMEHCPAIYTKYFDETALSLRMLQVMPA
ncbi:glycosyltransferase [Luteibacter sp. 9133]|uniref:glycosyltransferase family 4 protein n=1 Tax=Luteibacter sp. 9133 TaxID=1500891 RepID=UPI0009DD34BF|nr:glycosyltransferase [Luteibacter sp. 9133]